MLGYIEGYYHCYKRTKKLDSSQLITTMKNVSLPQHQEQEPPQGPPHQPSI